MFGVAGLHSRYQGTKVGWSRYQGEVFWGTKKKQSGQVENNNPFYAPIPSASGFGVGFGYLNTFLQGIWSTREQQ